MYSEDTARTRVLSRLTARTDFGDCWLIVRGARSFGYGRIQYGTRLTSTHIVAWYLATGDWPKPGENVCHTCDIRACWKNDDIGTYEVDGVLYERRGHLWLGNGPANTRDRFLKGRSASGDHHWSRLYPERILRGNQNPARIAPERMAHGDKHGMRLHPESVCRGEKNGNAKVTEATVREIRSRYKAGETMPALAKTYALGGSTVRLIVRRLRWKHVE